MAANASKNAAVKPMRRLLRVIELEQEQAQRRLEAAAAEFRQLEHAREAARERARRGRALVAASAASGQIADRIAGLEEIRLGQRAGAALVARIVEAAARADTRREEFLAKRVQLRQVETLVRAADARQAREAAQREQQSLDDWFLGGVLRARRGERERTGLQFDGQGDKAQEGEGQDDEGQEGKGQEDEMPDGERQLGGNPERKPVSKN